MRNKKIFILITSVLFILSVTLISEISYSKESISPGNTVPVSFVALVASPEEDQDKA